MWLSREFSLESYCTFKRKWFSLKLQHLQNNATLQKPCTVNWSVWTDCFSLRETHVGFYCMLHRILMHLQNKVISLKLQLLKSNLTLHSLQRVNWNVWIEFFSFKKTHVSFSWILHRILNHFQKKGILSVTTAFS